MLIIDDKKVEIHSDMCDVMFEKKEDLNINTKCEFLAFNLYEEVESFLKDKEYEIIECDECKATENRDVLDEDYDDFYEEFDEDEEFDDTRCDII